MKKTKRVKRTRKIHSKRRKQRGGINNYDIDISSDNRYIFITMKKQPKIMYKIDLLHKKFSKYRDEDDQYYPLEQKRDYNLFLILSREKTVNPLVDAALNQYQIDNVLYEVPGPNFSKQLIYPIAEADENMPVSPSKVSPPKVSPPKVFTPKVSPRKVSTPKVSPPKVSPRKVLSSRTRRNLVAAMKFAELHKTSHTVSNIMQGSPYLDRFKRIRNMHKS
jgi:hypothetical protein